ncbi:hypothetical protein HN873_072065 [Arachis hypogaea]|uniref:Tubulin-specific chaperone C N-terminal domain-containing protein n=2 Tax=Arachis hypogaea TaxID=3818 RepID=A0A444X7A1_ARAHY|nr:hypothetical protein Ahy_B10g105143 isoform A [Arachis hypogaea]
MWCSKAALQKKYSSMVEQLNKRHQFRSDNNNESKSSSSPTFESTSSFLTRFSNLKSFIESQLTHFHSLSSSNPSSLNLISSKSQHQSPIWRSLLQKIPTSFPPTTFDPPSKPSPI